MTQERLEQLKELLEITRKLISIDIYYCIYDTNCIVQYIYPEDGDKDGIHIGSKFIDPTGKLEEVLETEKCIHNYIPMDRFGFIMEGNLIPVYENGELCGAISTAYVPANQQQYAARELAVQSIYYLIMSVDMKNNNHCTRLYFDYEKQQFPTDAQHFDDFCEKSVSYIHPDDVTEFLDFTEVSKVHERLQSEKTLMMECRLLSVSGEYRWTELILTRGDEYEASDVYNTAVYMVRDIHERKSKELDILAKLEKNNQLLFKQGMTDELTNVYNRKGLAWFGEDLLKEAKKSDQYIYTMAADLNGLKYINDKFGHEEGDKAIRTIAEILQKAVPASAIVTRTGGDEFTIMAMLEKDSLLPMEIEKKLLKSMKDFNENSGLPYMVEVSFGWDFRPASELINLDDCMNRADNKMYDMKSRRKMSSRFSDKVGEEISRRLGSAKQRVFLLSADSATEENIRALFDAGYLLTSLKTTEDAVMQLGAYSEPVMLIVDDRLKDRSGIQFLRDLPEEQKRNAIMILLLEQEDADVIAEAFMLGVADVLIKPYNTALNKCRIRLLGQMNIMNRKLGQMLEQQVTI
ncbi:MAG: diguanylate cyclase [Oscillospiraceae bacterium]|nr:diguanylate cyclase [Oscillospiraceae bacterium]